ncbi:MAG: diphthine--ammonia ligase [Ignisphaera sp.]
MANLCALLSGGKDSNYALYKMMSEGHRIACLVVVKPMRDDSWLFHSIYPELAILQAEAMGLRDRVYLAEVSGIRDVELIEFADFLAKLKNSIDFDGMVCGAIASRYQLTRFEKVARELGVELYAPLWGLDQEQYMRKLIEEGFLFIITKISTMGLSRELLAKPITKSDVEAIVTLSRRYGFNAAFEGGEAETLVIDAPHYRSRICIDGEILTVSEFEHMVKIKRYWLGKKNSNCLTISR